jgi:hypothetical protein
MNPHEASSLHGLWLNICHWDHKKKQISLAKLFKNVSMQTRQNASSSSASEYTYFRCRFLSAFGLLPVFFAFGFARYFAFLIYF